ncbi:hypothetical protein [Mesorhizobium sp. B4-1-4]|uniref:hypothetical protein n=1 Tax=Mesorhizobium sp. B4-1-4 TaxID=2589888 RepID=UPI001126D1E1|nr:hypothetical protein [Mesorhizobium sp. B4-1-4]UCI32149.1 hypothetical protein FJW03_01415 [Mesorhizobium sp. B4-1-4]
MRIACLGWGSLIWNPEDFPVTGGWKNDGPVLPIEFARESGRKRITLVIADGVEPVTTLWTLMKVANLQAAKEALASRERINEAHIQHSIGW